MFMAILDSTFPSINIKEILQFVNLENSTTVSVRRRGRLKKIK